MVAIHREAEQDGKKKMAKKIKLHKMNREMHLVTENVQVVWMDNCKHV